MFYCEKQYSDGTIYLDLLIYPHEGNTMIASLDHVQFGRRLMPSWKVGHYVGCIKLFMDQLSNWRRLRGYCVQSDTTKQIFPISVSFHQTYILNTRNSSQETIYYDIYILRMLLTI